MAEIVRLTSRWTGWTGGPGYTTFYAEQGGEPFATAQAMTTAAKTFWTSLVSKFSSLITITVLPLFQVIEDTTGVIVQEGNVTTPSTPTVGTGSGGYAGNTGVCVTWNTGVVIDSRRLKGRTYLVPFMGCFDGEGTLDSVSQTLIAASANAMLAATPVHVVWHRPVAGAGGLSRPITVATVADRAAHLRSRSV